MKTILHLIDTTGPGGAETVFTDLVRGLPTGEYRSVPVISGPGWVADTLRDSGIEPVIVRSEGRNGLLFLIELLGTIRRVRPDLIHGHLIGSALYGALAGRLSGVPSICTFHGPADLPADDRYHDLRFRIIGGSATRVTFVSNALKGMVLDATTIPEGKTSVIYNGVDTARYLHAVLPSVRAELGLGSDVILIGTLGNLRAPKGYDVLLRALAVMPASSPAWHLAIAGDITGDVYPRIASLRDELGLQDRVTFLGFRQDVREVLASFDVFVLPSLTEGFSLATVQAMASGLPVVVTRSGGPEEIVRTEESGILVAANDHTALATALARVIGDPSLRDRLASAGRARVRDTFSLDAMISAYAAMYDSV